MIVKSAKEMLKLILLLNCIIEMKETAVITMQRKSFY